MTDEDKIRILKKYCSKLVDRNQEIKNTLLSINHESLLDAIKLKEEAVHQELSQDDGLYISRSSFLDSLINVIELWEEHTHGHK
jgi:hypothetical protein